ncbi:EF-hand domain and EF-hand domain pair-containing protein [Strongyloides ratti]|uniref:EF-hand domain and EF-hand domain pair-containing protein n=1 Tax=Strongyloides ratti TaxID=34506 RepID=A0A090L308_STRRB|nr:EF-hand domain and EF-hand domain pair-containing protein [Strongyloides ratti]CEF61859.1 EF-hand domain and EF-hand domain pair-containing protein [Strongyloides ratti]
MSSKDELRKLYDTNDSDKNGSLNLNEATKAITNVKENLKNPDNFENDFKKLAPNGEISFEDFCKLFKGF